MNIIINFDDKGRIGVEGPLQDKIFMYGILNAAMDIVRGYKPDEKPLIVPVTPVFPKIS